MKVLAVSNKKGGVGKTSLAANLAREISRVGWLVLLIDMDPQCDLSKIYVPNDYQGHTIMEVLEGKCDIEEACHESMDNLYIIPGSVDLAHFAFKHSESVLRHRLKNAEGLGEVDLVIIDTPPSISESTLTAYAAADQVLLVTVPEAFSAENLSNMVETIQHMQHGINPDLQIMGIAINKVDNRRGLTKVVQDKLRHIFGCDVFDSFISYDTALPTSQYGKVAVRDLHWKSRVLRQFNDLAAEVLERMVKPGGDGQALGE